MSLPGRACVALATRLARPAYAMVKTAHEARCGARPAARAISRVFVAVHGGVLLLAAHYGAHVGEMALLVSANARLVAPADLAPFIGNAPLCFGLWRWRGSFVAGRGGAGTDGLDIFGRSCKRLRTSFLMRVSSYKASSRDHCCPRRSDMASGCVRHRSAIFL